MDLAKNSACCVCLKQFTVALKKKVCSVCGMPVCKAHSGGTVSKHQKRVCDSCRKDEIKQMTYLVDNPERHELAKTHQEKVVERSHFRKKTSKLDRDIAALESQLEQKTKQQEASLHALHTKLKTMEDLNRIETEKLQSTRELLERAQHIEQYEEANLSAHMAELEAFRRDFGNQQHTVEELEREYRTLQDFIEGKVEVSVLRKNLCELCYKKVRYLVRSASSSQKKSPDSAERKVCCAVF